LVGVFGVILPGLKHLIKLHDKRRGDELISVPVRSVWILAGAGAKKIGCAFHVDQT
jgi:hypothetical protein